MALEQATADKHWSHPWHAWYGHILHNNNRISRKMYLLLSDNIHQTGQKRSWSPTAGGRHLSSFISACAHTLRHWNVPVRVSWHQQSAPRHPAKKGIGIKRLVFFSECTQGADFRVPILVKSVLLCQVVWFSLYCTLWEV